MTFSTPRVVLALATVALASLSERADAQCATCPQPTIAYSPVAAPQPVVQPAFTQSAFAQPAPVQQVVLQPVQQPVVLQQAPPRYDGWYPGKYLGRLFRPRPPVAAAPVAPVAVPVAVPPVAPQPTFVTAAYRPTFPPSYTTYAAAPAVQTVARPVTLAPLAYTAPAVSTCAMPVTVSALSPCGDYGTCGSCPGGVTTAGFQSPVYSGGGSGCASCAGQSTPSYSGGATFSNPGSFGGQGASNPGGQGSSGFGNQGGGALEPTPALPFNSPAPEQRINNFPSSDPGPTGPDAFGSGTLNGGDTTAPAPQGNGAGTAPGAVGGDSTSWWEPPQLFDGSDRSASRAPTTSVWNAVYHQPAAGTASAQRTAYREASPIGPKRRNVQVGVGGWRSAE